MKGTHCSLLWFESNNCQTYTVTPPLKGMLGWRLESRVIKALARERERLLARENRWRQPKLKFKLGKYKRIYRVLIYSYSLKGLCSRVNQTLSTWSVRSVQHGLCVSGLCAGCWQVHEGQTTGSITVRLTVYT